MDSALFDAFWSLILWNFVPQMITKFLLSQFYSFFYGRSRRPEAQSAKFKRHYRFVYFLVVCAYFAYCIISSVGKLEPNLYSRFGIHRADVDTNLRLAFRVFAKQEHPDKMSSGDNSAYLLKKSIYEVLSNKETRVSYDLFGPQVLKSVRLSPASKPKMREYIEAGLVDWLMYYAATSLILLFFYATGSSSALFWRLVTLLACALFELDLYVQPFYSKAIAVPGMHAVIRWAAQYAIFERIKILRQAIMYLGIAVSQVVSLFWPEDSQIGLPKMVDNLSESFNVGLKKEIAMQLKAAVNPFASDQDLFAHLKRRMGKLAVDLKVLDSK